MIKSDEQKFVVLLSLYECGGSASKSAVLDNIERTSYYDFDSRDLKWMTSRNEITWRNDLAFTRKHLELRKCIGGWERDRWELTVRGRSELSRLASRVATAHRLTKLTPKAQRRAVELANGSAESTGSPATAG